MARRLDGREVVGGVRGRGNVLLRERGLAWNQLVISSALSRHAPTLGEPRMTTFRFCAADGAIVVVRARKVGGGSEVEDGDGWKLDESRRVGFS